MDEANVIDDKCDWDGHAVFSVLDEVFALTYLIECPSMVKDTRLFGKPPDYIFLVEPSGFEGEFRVLKEMPILSAYTGQTIAEGKRYNSHE